MIRVTLAAVPRRGTVLSAKATVLIGLVAVTATPAVLASLLAGRLILPGRGYSTAHGYAAMSLDGRPDAARRGRIDPLPPARHRPQPRRRHGRARLGQLDRDRSRPPVPVPDHHRIDVRRDVATAPRADCADDGRPRHPEHRSPEKSAHRRLGRTGRPRHMGRLRPGDRRSAASQAGRVSNGRRQMTAGPERDQPSSPSSYCARRPDALLGKWSVDTYPPSLAALVGRPLTPRPLRV